MNIYKLEPGTFKLDGGATFGVIPKVMWQKVYPADENNLCKFSLRSLLIDTGNRLVLIDTGIGNKQEEKFFKYYYREGHHSIEKSLNEIGFSADDVTDVVVTHLHFDHVGDAVTKTDNGELAPTFKNATYHVSEKQWEWAMNPNQREKASYLDENIIPLQKSKELNLLTGDCELVPGIELRIFEGHTDGLVIPLINYNGKTIVFTADLIPLSAQIPSSWVCGYDTRPLISFHERNTLLKEAGENGYILFFQHDYYTECCLVEQTEKGWKMGQVLTFEEITKAFSELNV